MKKVISIFVFAVLVIMISTTAFALEVIVPKPVVSPAEALKYIQIYDANTSDTFLVNSPKDSTFYFMLSDSEWENITIKNEGIVTASYVDYDPEKMIAFLPNGEEVAKYSIFNETTGEFVSGGHGYDEAKSMVKKYNSSGKDVYAIHAENNVNIIEFIIKGNHSASYKEGSAKIDATLNGKKYAAILYGISDVYFKNVGNSEEFMKTAVFSEKNTTLQSSGTVFLELDQLAPEAYLNSPAEDIYKVEEYAETDSSVVSDPIYDIIEFNIGEPGCSAYLAHTGGYYIEEGPATVLTTKAFELVAGGKVVVKDEHLTITIPKVSPNQKGVNFANDMRISAQYEPKKEIRINIYSDTVIHSDYSVKIDTGINYSELRDYFKVNKEETNITTYYVYHDDGTCIGKNTVDYSKIDGKKEVKFSIDEKAGDTLNSYIITTDKPENAESVAELNDTLTISKNKIVYGNQTKVSVDLSKGSNVTMAQFAVKYDPAMLKLVSATAGDLMKDATVNTDKEGTIYFGWDNPNPVTEAGSILELTFATIDGIKIGKTAIEIDEDEKFVFAKNTLEELSVDIENGNVTIMEGVYGDLNDDNEVNIKDAYLARLIAAKLITATEVQSTLGDVDLDGKITAIDANLIRKYVVKLIDSLPIK